jgi:hypothetical protein
VRDLSRQLGADINKFKPLRNDKYEYRWWPPIFTSMQATIYLQFVHPLITYMYVAPTPKRLHPGVNLCSMVAELSNT